MIQRHFVPTFWPLKGEIKFSKTFIFPRKREILRNWKRRNSLCNLSLHIISNGFTCGLFFRGDILIFVHHFVFLSSYLKSLIAFLKMILASGRHCLTLNLFPCNKKFSWLQRIGKYVSEFSISVLHNCCLSLLNPLELYENTHTFLLWIYELEAIDWLHMWIRVINATFFLNNLFIGNFL